MGSACVSKRLTPDTGDLLSDTLRGMNGILGRVAAMVMLMAAALGGCSAPPHASVDPLGAAPADFTLDVTVLAGRDVQQTGEAHRTQSRYVLFPDGSLHHAVDVERERGGDWLPPLTRMLTRAQMAEVWSLAQQAGFADPSTADETINFKLVTAAPNEIVYLAGVSASGDRWNYIRRGPADQPSDAGITQLVRLLAQLAWASDLADPRVKIQPRRYDFGPDPYARYRK